MSFFRPHKSKPRQFNYIPRHYDPVKEERDQRRKELHGTSSLDQEEEYVPGKYIRTQRDARDAARGSESNGSFKRIRNMMIIAVILGIFGLMIVPRFVNFAQKAKEENEAKEAQRRRMILTEELEGIDGIDDAKLFMEGLDDKEAWQRSVRSITIVPDDYDFSQDK
jgi:flagellar biosynthesis/type III secretory pathway M-ring protein FliF/YscJ